MQEVTEYNFQEVTTAWLVKDHTVTQLKLVYTTSYLRLFLILSSNLYLGLPHVLAYSCFRAWPILPSFAFLLASQY
jgi:hypothetical protein